MSTETQLILTNREREVLAIAWQCFTTDPKYTKRSAETTLSVLKKRLRDHVSHVSQDNPAPLAVKGRGRRPAAKKRAAKDADDGTGEDAPRPKKRGKKAAMGPELTGEEADTMMGLGGREEEKVKEEPEDVGFGWGVEGDEVEDEI